MPVADPDKALKVCMLMQAKFRILQQKYVEQIMGGDTQGALKTLRQELAPMQINSKEVKRLSGAPHPSGFSQCMWGGGTTHADSPCDMALGKRRCPGVKNHSVPLNDLMSIKACTLLVLHLAEQVLTPSLNFCHEFLLNIKMLSRVLVSAVGQHCIVIQ